MAMSKPRSSNSSKHSSPPSTTNSSKIQVPFNGNGSDTSHSASSVEMGASASEVHRLNRSSDRVLNERIDYKDSTALCHIRQHYKINSPIDQYLLKLKDYEIVIVCDDSGSMNTKVGRTDDTRWNELCEIVKTIIEIGVIFDSNGVDIYFLNRKKYPNVKDFKDVKEAFAKTPNGFTPLVPILKDIFKSPLARCGRKKKLLVFVATDGEPTDEDGNPVVPQLKHLMEETRNSETTYVSFLACTDDSQSIRYLKEWDRTMLNVDVTNDFKTERRKILQVQGNDFPFTYGDYIVKALAGAIIPWLDRLNEKKVERTARP